jgi:hypothetical protein
MWGEEKGYLSLPTRCLFRVQVIKTRDEAGVPKEIAHDETERQHIEIESG